MTIDNCSSPHVCIFICFQELFLPGPINSKVRLDYVYINDRFVVGFHKGKYTYDTRKLQVLRGLSPQTCICTSEVRFISLMARFFRSASAEASASSFRFRFARLRFMVSVFSSSCSFLTIFRRKDNFTENKGSRKKKV